MRVLYKAAVVGAAVVALAGIGVGSAFADPYATPKVTDIVGVGSDTVTPLYDGGVSVKDPGTFVTDYNTQSPVPTNLLWSWDAVPPAGVTATTIVTKPGCAAIPRPDGSSAGITALNDNVKLSNGDYCIDFARSARAPKAVTSGTNGPDTFAVLAGDAITWSSPKPKTGQTSPVPANLTIADMTKIYTCQSNGTSYNWDDFGGKDATIVPVLPQSSSGTRSTFLAALGHGVNNPLVPGACVVNGTTSTGLLIEENTGVATSAFGNDTQFDPKGVPAVDDLFPYSVGDYIAQGSGEGSYNGRTIGGHTTPDFAHGVMGLHDTNSTAPTATDNTAPYSKATVVNPSFTSALRGLVYNVVRNGGTATAPAFPTAPSYEATALPKIFGSTGWECTATAAKEDLVSYGFVLEGRNCGALSAGS
jgi:ABC-type phosphate transport system substrate-binding protein